jgi:hypothetical protein
MQTAPICRIHNRPMDPIPLFHHFDSKGNLKADTERFWRCTAPGCPKVHVRVAIKTKRTRGRASRRKKRRG